MSALFPSRNLAQKLSYTDVGDIVPQSKSLEHMEARFLKECSSLRLIKHKSPGLQHF